MSIAHTLSTPEIPVRATGYDPAALLTTSEAAKLLRVSTSWLRKQRYHGDGPRSIVFGPRCIRYRNIDIQVWLTERAMNPRKPQAAAETFPSRA